MEYYNRWKMPTESSSPGPQLIMRGRKMEYRTGLHEGRIPNDALGRRLSNGDMSSKVGKITGTHPFWAILSSTNRFAINSKPEHLSTATDLLFTGTVLVNINGRRASASPTVAVRYSTNINIGSDSSCQQEVFVNSPERARNKTYVSIHNCEK